MKTRDDMRRDAAGVVLHLGRSWSGTDLEDGCPCLKAPCGLVVSTGTAPDCVEHGYLHPPRTMRQGHPVERCPAVTVLEPHHRQARFRSDEEFEAWRRDPANRLVRNLDRATVERGMRIARHFHEEAS